MKSIVPGMVAASIMIPSLINLLVTLLVTLRVRDDVDLYLSRCSVMKDNKATFGGLGFVGDVHRVGTAACILAFSKPFIKRGIVDKVQVAKFPKALRVLIVVPFFLNLAFFTALAIFQFWIWLCDI